MFALLGAFERTLRAVAGAAARFVCIGFWRARRRDRLASKADRLRQALSRIIDQPERVAAEPTVPAKIMTAAPNTAVAVIIKKVLERGAAHLMDGQRRGDDTPFQHRGAADSRLMHPRHAGQRGATGMSGPRGRQYRQTRVRAMKSGLSA